MTKPKYKLARVSRCIDDWLSDYTERHQRAATLCTHRVSTHSDEDRDSATHALGVLPSSADGHSPAVSVAQPRIYSSDRKDLPKDDATNRRIHDLEPWDNVRRDMLVLMLRTVLERGVEGDLAELGVWKGSTARLIHHYVPERRLHLFDTFSGFDGRDVAAERTTTGQDLDERMFADTSVEGVMHFVAPRNGNVSCYPDFFPRASRWILVNGASRL